tara:strand:+ start:681 stop:869 length:189 start_codon:yes stop_codon:yes gene_type:complete
MRQPIFEHVATVPARKRPRTYRVPLFGIVGEGTLAEWRDDILAGLALVGLFAIGMLYWVVAS